MPKLRVTWAPANKKIFKEGIKKGEYYKNTTGVHKQWDRRIEMLSGLGYSIHSQHKGLEVRNSVALLARLGKNANILLNLFPHNSDYDITCDYDSSYEKEWTLSICKSYEER